MKISRVSYSIKADEDTGGMQGGFYGTLPPGI